MTRHLPAVLLMLCLTGALVPRLAGQTGCGSWAAVQSWKVTFTLTGQGQNTNASGGTTTIDEKISGQFLLSPAGTCLWVATTAGSFTNGSGAINDVEVNNVYPSGQSTLSLISTGGSLTPTPKTAALQFTNSTFSFSPGILTLSPVLLTTISGTVATSRVIGPISGSTWPSFAVPAGSPRELTNLSTSFQARPAISIATANATWKLTVNLSPVVCGGEQKKAIIEMKGLECPPGGPRNTFSPGWGPYPAAPWLFFQSGESLQLQCTDEGHSLYAFALYYYPSASAITPALIGGCAWPTGCNSATFTYMDTGDTMPGCLVGTQWISKDYGNNTNILGLNPYTLISDFLFTTTLDWIIWDFDATTGNRYKTDRAFLYASGPPTPTARGDCQIKPPPEGSFVRDRTFEQRHVAPPNFLGGGSSSSNRSLVPHSQPATIPTDDLFQSILIVLLQFPPGVEEASSSSPADLNSDGSIDNRDFSVLQGAFGSCLDANSFQSAADLDDDGCVTFRDYQGWFSLYSANGVLPDPTSTPVTVHFTAPAATFTAGSTFMLSVSADITDPVLGWGLTPQFDPTLLALDNVALGPLWSSAGSAALGGLAFPAAVSGNNTLLATLTFHTLQPGPVSLSFGVNPNDATQGFALLAGGFAGLSGAVKTYTPAAGPVLVSPAQATGAAQVMTFRFNDPLGWQNIGVVNILVNSSLDGRRACYLAYSQPLNSLFLVDDSGDGAGPFAGSAVLSAGPGSISNSQCTVSWVAGSVAGDGNTLALNLEISLTASFSGNRIIYLASRDVSDKSSGWRSLGVWQVPGVTQPTTTAVTGMSPGRGAGFVPGVFTFNFSDAKGFPDLRRRGDPSNHRHKTVSRCNNQPVPVRGGPHRVPEEGSDPDCQADQQPADEVVEPEIDEDCDRGRSNDIFASFRVDRWETPLDRRGRERCFMLVECGHERPIRGGGAEAQRRGCARSRRILERRRTQSRRKA